MVLLDRDSTLSAVSIEERLKDLWPELPRASDVQVLAAGSQIAFALGDADVHVAVMPAPYPWTDLEGPCTTSLLWPDATKALRHHRQHIVVCVAANVEPLALTILLTRATAAVLASVGGLGVYWANAAMVVPKQMFLSFATEDLPYPIWVDFRVAQQSPSTCTGFTHGLASLGHKEFEVPQSPESAADLYSRLTSLVLYLLENGPVIKDEDTVGEEADELIRVRHSKSIFGHEGTVARLDYERPSSSSFKWRQA
jgi:hypothetical protein